MQKTPGLVNETPKTQVERPGPVFMMMALLITLVGLCIFGSFIYFFAQNVQHPVYAPVPSATSTLDPTSAVLATNAAGSLTPKPTGTATSPAAPTQPGTQQAAPATAAPTAAPSQATF